MKAIFILFLLASCQSIPLDHTPAPIDNGLWTLELTDEQGHKDLGLLGAKFSTTEGRYFRIPLFHKGQYSIRSKRCAFSVDQQFKVKKSGEVRFYFKDLVKNMPDGEFACIFNVVLFLDGLDKGFQGQFYLLKDEGFESIEVELMGKKYKDILWFQMSEIASTNIQLRFPVEQGGTIFFEGCGRSDEVKFTRTFVLPLKWFVGVEPEQCIYSIGMEYDDGTKGILEFNFKVFNKEVLAIARPVIRYKKGKLTLRSSKPVAYMAINGNFKRRRRVSKKVGPDNYVWASYVTANGRYGLLGIKNGRIVWTPSVNY